ncbi:transcriptional repressor [Geomonas sp. Red875]|uniref:Transcriptional repressor n=1 Tax=Geomesophilobacter sediminis TaxID=2798584 RepID=A0A8J7J1E1_9BACT|nr:transcriptional repressor [Geomesophilobacter sediminis]
MVDIITRDLSHPSARAIFQAARELHPSISLSTVYSTLAMLKALHLVKELEFEGMDNRYDMDTESHVNLLCTRCGRVVDFDFVPPLQNEVETLTGFTISEGRFEYYGICAPCRS